MKLEIKKESIERLFNIATFVAAFGAAEKTVDMWKKVNGFSNPVTAIGGIGLAAATGFTAGTGVDYLRKLVEKVLDDEEDDESKKDSEEEEAETV